MKLSKKKIISLVAALLALTVVTGTWAYYNQTQSIDNELETSEYGSRIVEDFSPSQELEPGELVNKGVGVINTGDYALLARVKFDEKWQREGVVFKEIKFNDKNAAGDFLIGTVAASGTPEDAWTAVQADAADGLVPTDATDESVVYKQLNLGTDWILGDDGYYYYAAQLAPGAKTNTNILEALRLASNADVGVYAETKYVSTAPTAEYDSAYAAAKAAVEAKLGAGKATEAAIQDEMAAWYGWIKEENYDAATNGAFNYRMSDSALDASKAGYAKAGYTLTVTTEVLQATQEAVAADWSSVPANVLAAWNLGA